MKEVIKIASNTKYYGLTNKALYKGLLKNKNCGDEIKIEFDCCNDQINNFRYEGEVCIYCLASASLIANNKAKITIKKIKELQNQIYSFFDKKNKIKKTSLDKFTKLLHKKNNSRKECIALPVNAIIKIKETYDS